MQAQWAQWAQCRQIAGTLVAASHVGREREWEIQMMWQIASSNVCAASGAAAAWAAQAHEAGIWGAGANRCKLQANPTTQSCLNLVLLLACLDQGQRGSEARGCRRGAWPPVSGRQGEAEIWSHMLKPCKTTEGSDDQLLGRKRT